MVLKLSLICSVSEWKQREKKNVYGYGYIKVLKCIMPETTRKDKITQKNSFSMLLPGCCGGCYFFVLLLNNRNVRWK